MKRCPNCNGFIIRMGHKEKPFLCKTCNKWFSEPEVTPKQTHGDLIRRMTDDELADEYIRIYHELPRYSDSWAWLRAWLKQEVADA